MCGIVGAFLAEGSTVGWLIDGLRTLEYRGYDSAGVAVVADGALHVRRAVGRLSELEARVAADPLPPASIGIGHTRWATHGEPSDTNAHPHRDSEERIALVHNGILENYAALRAELVADGVELRSDTDTEVLAHLIGRAIAGGAAPADAVRAALARVEGYYAIALVVRGDDPALICARHGPPLCVGATDVGAWLASDVLALLEHTRDVRYLEDGDVATLRPGSVEITRADGKPVDRPVRHITWEAEAADMAGFPHYMLKEIHEQPGVLARTLGDRVDLDGADVRLEGAWDDAALRTIDRVQVVACGTALHAGLVARYLIEGLAGVPVDVDYASEFRYREPRLVPGTLALAVSQSGETADTLAALRLAGELGARKTCICNVVGSSMVRESEAHVLTEAGPEIGVASTKAFVAMLVAATLIAVRIGRANRRLTEAAARELLDELRRLRPRLETLLAPAEEERLREIADRHRSVKGFLFLGRGINYPVALEGALKLKEISYMHAEGYPAGEMKHGPIALVEPDLTTVAIGSTGRVADKLRSNIEQVKARGGRVVYVGSDEAARAIADEAIMVPPTSEWLSPILNVVPLQLLAYHIADLRGCDIDKPRNLAKSVTVE